MQLMFSNDRFMCCAKSADGMDLHDLLRIK